MTTKLPKTSLDLGLVSLRVMLAAVFLFHGSQKLFGVFDGPGLSGFSGFLESLGVPVPMVSAILAALAEFLGGIALLTGVAFRPMMIPLCFTMLVAAFGVHGSNGFSAQNGGLEYPLTLAVAAFALFWTGPGRLAVSLRKKD